MSCAWDFSKIRLWCLRYVQETILKAKVDGQTEISCDFSLEYADISSLLILLCWNYNWCLIVVQKHQIISLRLRFGKVHNFKFFSSTLEFHHLTKQRGRSKNKKDCTRLQHWVLFHFFLTSPLTTPTQPQKRSQFQRYFRSRISILRYTQLAHDR